MQLNVKTMVERTTTGKPDSNSNRGSGRGISNSRFDRGNGTGLKDGSCLTTGN